MTEITSQKKVIPFEGTIQAKEVQSLGTGLMSLNAQVNLSHG
jgi:hypothetical protein